MKYLPFILFLFVFSCEKDEFDYECTKAYNVGTASFSEAKRFDTKKQADNYCNDSASTDPDVTNYFCQCFEVPD